jgi:Lon protease-like protein
VTSDHHVGDDDRAGEELPMFPLGSVLLPGMVLPLRVFEPRYRVLVDTVLLADRQEFGCVLIERGSEVGGGDVRTMVGCTARLVDVARHDDGQVSMVAVGSGRLRVMEWLPDDPFPRARVQPWHDEDPPAVDEGPAVDQATLDTIERIERAVASLGALAVELGLVAEFAPAELDDDPSVRTYQLATISPLGALDRQTVLECPTLAARAPLLEELVEDQRVLLEARRGAGEP